MTTAPSSAVLTLQTETSKLNQTDSTDPSEGLQCTANTPQQYIATLRIGSESLIINFPKDNNDNTKLPTNPEQLINQSNAQMKMETIFPKLTINPEQLINQPDALPKELPTNPKQNAACKSTKKRSRTELPTNAEQLNAIYEPLNNRAHAHTKLETNGLQELPTNSFKRQPQPSRWMNDDDIRLSLCPSVVVCPRISLQNP